ncbi:MAG: choice-of-anchor D domain-containing protein, partial [Verrucomicrobiales bacterium]|nr:choice-of-anchor D domain-containing protein [Verrucomicrobiales bacterium]
GAGSGGSLIVRRDGTFTLTASLDGALNLPGLPAPALRGGSTLTLTPNALTLAGNFEGGLLAPGATASGTLRFDLSNGLSLTGEAVLPPQSFGVLRLQGVDRPEITARLFHDGYSLDQGARLQVVGVSSDLLFVSPFTNRANADFTAVVASGDFAVPNAFRISGGRMELRRRAGTVSLLITNSPTLTLLPGADVQTTIAAPFTSLSVATDGQFYADSGTRTVSLLGGASLRGRLEIGNNPGTGTPGLAVSPSPLDFGTIDFGSVTSRVMRFRNTGTEPLVVGLLSSSGAFVPSRSDFPVATGQFVDVPVEFRPSIGGATNAQLSIVMNPGGAQPSVPLAGTARPVPIYSQFPASAGFGNVAQGKTSTRTLVVRNLGVAPLVLSNATLTGPFTLSPTVNRQTLAPGASVAFTLTYNASVIGATNGLLTLTASDSTRLHTTELTGTTFAERWLLVHEGGPALHGIALHDATHGWAVGENSTLLRTDTGGRSWKPVPPKIGGDFRAISISGDLVAIAGDEGVVMRSTDRGTTWQRVTSPVAAAPTNHWEAVLLNPEGQLLLAGSRSGGGGILARETAAGVQTVALPAEPLHALAQFKGSLTLSNRIIAVGDGGRLLRSTDGGLAWTSTTTAPGLPLRGVALTRLLVTDTDPRVLLVGDSGVLLRANSFLGPLQRTVFTLRDFRAAIPGMAVGRDGLIAQVATLNSSFTPEDATGAYDLQAIGSSPAGTFAVGQAGQIWFRPTTAPTGPFLALDPGHLDFGVLGAGQSRTLELQIANRGPAPLNVNAITVSGAPAFTVSPAQLLNVPSNGVRTVTVRFTPPALGHHTATLEFATSESSVKQRVTVEGRAQANDWLALSDPGAGRLTDLQMPSDAVAFAASSGRIFKSLNRGTNWSQVAIAPGTLSRLHFASTTLGFAVGGDVSFRTFPPCTNDCQSFILRTADGGSTWSSRPTGVGTAVADLHMATSLIGYAVTRAESTFGRTTPGDILRTTDGGLTWTPVTRPAPTTGAFSGSTVHAPNGTTVFVATGGELHRTTSSGATWTRVLNLGTTLIADLQFTDSNHGVLVGSGGAFRRTTTGGATSTSWTPQPAFTTADLRRVHFLNATTGWVTGADASFAYLFRTENGATTWIPEIRETLGSDGGPTGIAARSASLALVTDGAVVLKPAAHSNVVPPFAALPALRDVGVVALGSNTTVTVPLRNLGTNTLVVSALQLVDPAGSEAFALLNTTPFNVAPLGSAGIQIRYSATKLGRSIVRLVVNSNGAVPTTGCELVGETKVFPTPITFDTEPPGLALNLDGRAQSTGPVTVTVVGPSTVPNDVINPFEWQLGSAHSVTAPSNQVRGNFEYRFQSWQPAQPDATLRLVATNQPASYRAVFVAVRPIAAPAAQALALAAVERDAAPSSGLPHGPFVRVSSATLLLPGLGEAAVSGAALLASDRFQFTLSSSRLGDPQLVAVDAGSWAVNYTNAPLRFVLRAQNPGLTVLGTPASAESLMTFDVSRTQISAQLRTLGATPFVPGVAELGPATLAFSSVPSGATRISTFTTTASLRALPKPGGGFAVDRAIAFRASDGPFTNAITTFPNPILDTPLLALRPASGARLEVRRNSQGAYGVLVTNFSMSLLGGPATTVAGSVDGSRLTFTSGRTLALGDLVYSANSNPTLEWDFSGPSFRAVMPAGSLKVPGLSQDLAVPTGLVLDTAGDFDVKLPLPALSFDGIGINAGGPIEHNFVRFYREEGVAGVQLRDRRSFLGNTFKLRLDVDTAGRASGSFAGELVLRDFLGCDEIGLGEISMSYDSAQPDFQFQGRAIGTLCSAASADFRVQFGSGGARVCHLICVDGCAETACLTTP